MNLKAVGKKAQKILRAGCLYSNEDHTQWFWEKYEDGSVIRLGSTLKEAWRQLDKLVNEHSPAHKK